MRLPRATLHILIAVLIAAFASAGAACCAHAGPGTTASDHAHAEGDGDRHGPHERGAKDHPIAKTVCAPLCCFPVSGLALAAPGGASGAIRAAARPAPQDGVSPEPSRPPPRSA